MLPLCEELGIAYLPWFPLASGLLSGKYTRGQPPPKGTRLDRAAEAFGALDDATFDKLDALTAWAADHGRSLLDLAFAWLLAKPAIASVIAGATKPEQVRANVAGGEWSLTRDQVTEVDRIAR